MIWGYHFFWEHPYIYIYIYPVNSINGYYPDHINLPLKASGLRCSKKHASITVAAWVASKYFRTVPANDASMLSHLRSCCVLNQPSDDMTKSTSNQQSYSENQVLPLKSLELHDRNKCNNRLRSMLRRKLQLLDADLGLRDKL